MPYDDVPFGPPDRPALPDPRIARAEQRLCKLETASSCAVKVTEALAEQTCEAAKASPDPRASRGLAEVFNRVCRNLRFTVALEAMMDDYLHELLAGDPAAEFWPRGGRQNARRDDPSTPEPDRMDERERAHGAVLEVIGPDGLAGEAGDRIHREFHERLYESERYDDFLDLPMEDLVELICKDLAVTPDWVRWDGYDWPPWRTDKTRQAPPAPGAEAPPGKDGAGDVPQGEALAPAMAPVAPAGSPGAPPGHLPTNPDAHDPASG